MIQSDSPGINAPLKKLLTLTETIDDNWLDRDISSITGSMEYGQLLEQIPPLKDIFEDGAEKDPKEYGRTLSHVFRSVATHNQMKRAAFQQPSLSPEKLSQVYELFSVIQEYRQYLMPIILWFHDIGKMEDRENHTQASYELVRKFQLLDSFGLSVEEKILIEKVIQHHLVIGTLYTGEGSFHIFDSMLRDEYMQQLIGSGYGGALWTDFSTMFTIIDLCGYPYNKLTNSHIDSYFQLMGTIKKILLPHILSSELGTSQIRQISTEMIDWRLVCFLRMFMFLNRTKDHTFKNYLKAVQSGTARFLKREIDSEGWQAFKERHLSRFPRIQFKYGLAFFCRLGLTHLDQWLNPAVPEESNPQLIRFMVNLDERIGREEADNSLDKEALWEVSFQNYPRWGEDNRLLEDILIKPGVMEDFIHSGISIANPESAVNTLNLDFKMLLSAT